MRYPERLNHVLDVTKAPYFADPTGQRDCTEAIRQALNDCVRGYVEDYQKTREKLVRLHEERGEDVYIGLESGRYVENSVHKLYYSLPEDIPAGKILFFPRGTYLVSDTLCYTLDLSVRQQDSFVCENCRGIHILGEERERTVIRLADNAPGFEAGQKKPMLSFNRVATEGKETTNTAQQNSLADITVDCGHGNVGAVGVLYVSSNAGRIENVEIRGAGGFCGMLFDMGSEGCVEDLTVSGFDYGIQTDYTSPLIFDRADLSGNRKAGVLSKNGCLYFRHSDLGKAPALSLQPGHCGRFYVDGEMVEYDGDITGNYLYRGAEYQTPERPWPSRPVFTSDASWACVDDFGAVGDGKTDSTVAIQRAMNSGKEWIFFTGGSYLLERSISVPATVKVIDFAQSNIVAGRSLMLGEKECAFSVDAEAEEPLYFANFFGGERCVGHFRLCRHASRRTVVFRDVLLPTGLYFNTVPGGEVYFDNCFTHTFHYTQDAYHREGYTPVLCRMIPVELHGQKAFGRNLNIERADVELLNDGSELLVDGYKTEGCGVMVWAKNGAKTELRLINSAWWCNRLPENEMYRAEDSSMRLIAGLMFAYPEEKELSMALRVKKGGEETRFGIAECGEPLAGEDHLGRNFGSMLRDFSVKG